MCDQQLNTSLMPIIAFKKLIIPITVDEGDILKCFFSWPKVRKNKDVLLAIKRKGNIAFTFWQLEPDIREKNTLNQRRKRGQLGDIFTHSQNPKSTERFEKTVSSLLQVFVFGFCKGQDCLKTSAFITFCFFISHFFCSATPRSFWPPHLAVPSEERV